MAGTYPGIASFLVLIAGLAPMAVAQSSDLRGGMAPKEVTIRFEGGIASATYAELVAELGRQGLVTAVPEIDRKGGTPAEVLAASGRLVGSTVAPSLEEYLCGVNLHVCARSKGGRFEWKNLQAPPAAVPPTTGCPGRDLPRYVVCVPEVKVKAYRTTLLVRYDPRQERLADIIVRKGGCEVFDERCQKTIQYLNKEDILSPAYPGGRIRLPVQAYALTLPVESSIHFERISRTVEAVRKTLGDQNALTVDGRSLFYTVPQPLQKQTSHHTGPGPAAGEVADPATLLARMRYPYLPPNAFPPNLGPVLVGVWDGHFDDQHCGFQAPGLRSLILADNLPPAEGDPPRPTRLEGCEGMRPPLEERWDHGTHVAGLIGARRTGSRMLGINPRVALWTYETDSRGMRLETDDDPILGLAEKLAGLVGLQAPLVVVNLSFRLPPSGGDRPTRLESIISDYKNTLFVAAAGNSGQEIRQSSQCRVIPACLTADRDSEAGDNVISVVALDQTGQGRWRDPADAAKGSNYGPVFDVAAIGEAVSTLYGNAYGVLRGTSVAAPFVTGLASLVYARVRTSVSPKQVKERILATADFSETLDQLVAFGRINFDRALRLDSDVLTRKGCADPGCELLKVRVNKGPGEVLRVVDGQREGRDLLQPVTIRVRDIRRLAAASDAPDAPYWVVYLEEGRVLRKIREARFEGTPQIRLRDGAGQPVSGIRDYACSLACQD